MSRSSMSLLNILALTFILGSLVGLAMARPQHGLEGAFEQPQQADNSLDSGELRRYLQTAEDPALAGLQMQLLAQQYAANNFGSLPWEQLLRAPETKRQVRYRQCYFNPISCFRK